MVDCIVCRNPLQDILRSMNMEYHPECAPSIIEQAWHFIDETNEKERKSVMSDEELERFIKNGNPLGHPKRIDIDENDKDYKIKFSLPPKKENNNADKNS